MSAQQTDNQKAFMQHIWAMIDYWETTGPNTKDALEGLAFSILVAIDGGAAITPPTGDELTVGWLHEVFFGYRGEK